MKFMFDPIYLSSNIGYINPKAKIEDELRNLSIIDNVRNKEYFISEVTCYYARYINYIEIEYTSKLTGNKLRYLHLGKESIFCF